MWGIFLYYIWIFFALYLWWVLFFCAYHTKTTRDYEKGDKMKFPIWSVIVSFLAAFIPGLNIVALAIMIIFMVCLCEDENVEFRNILFKSI